MTSTAHTSATAPTQHLDVDGNRYAYRRFGATGSTPMVCLQHFTGTLDNWDPAIIDELAKDREVILFENAGIGGSSGAVPTSIDGMTQHALRFVDALGLPKLHILGFSLGGFLAQNMAIARPELVAIYVDATMPMSEKLKHLFFPATSAGQAAADAFVARLGMRTADIDPPAGPDVAPAQLSAMIAWANWKGDVAGKLARIPHRVLVTNGDNDTMIPTKNSFVLAAGLPNATLIVYPNSGHGAIYQYASTYVAHVREFLQQV